MIAGLTSSLSRKQRGSRVLSASLVRICSKTAQKAANEFLKSEHVHDTSCLITDLHMPRLSGVDLQDRLITRGHWIPIIFITAYPNETVRARAMKAGAIAFLSKPYNADHLLGYLEKALKAN